MRDQVDVDEACSLIAVGGKLQDTATLFGVDIHTLWDALNYTQEAKAKYSAARVHRATLQGEEIFDEIRELRRIADAVELGLLDPLSARASISAREHVIKSRQWMMAKMAPADWGDKQEIDVKGGITVNIKANFGDLA